MERHFEGKLYNPRTIEGEPNWEALKQVRELDNALSGHEAYVGLAPYGSVIGGYGNENSDIDVKIFFDSELYKNGYNFEELSRIAQAVQENVKQQGGKEFHIYFDDIHNDVFTQPEYTDPAEYGRRVADIYRSMTGNKIAGYRKRVAEYIGRFPEGYQDTFKRNIVNELMVYEMPSIKKLAERKSGIDESEFSQERRKLWESRIDRMVASPENNEDPV